MVSSSNHSLSDLSSRLQHLLDHIPHSPQLMAKLPMLVTVLLVTLLGIKLAEFTWSFFPSEEENKPAAVTTSRIQPTTKQSTSLNGISMLHLFGVAEKNNAQVKGPINAPETRLSLLLHGVFASEIPEQSLAIIASKGSEDKTYNIGDTVPGGAVLHEVYKDRVILSRNGKLEALRLKIKEADISITSSAPSSNRGETSDNITESDSTPVITQMIDNFRKDPQSFWKQVRISPVNQDGQITGYQFSHNDRRLMKDLGIESRDIITAINGIPVTDNTAIFGMMKDIENLTQLSLTVLRNDQTETININFD